MFCPCRLRKCYNKLTKEYKKDVLRVQNMFDARSHHVVGFRFVRLNILFTVEKSLSECLQEPAAVKGCKEVLDNLSGQHPFNAKKGILNKVLL